MTSVVDLLFSYTSTLVQVVVEGNDNEKKKVVKHCTHGQGYRRLLQGAPTNNKK